MGADGDPGQPQPCLGTARAPWVGGAPWQSGAWQLLRSELSRGGAALSSGSGRLAVGINRSCCQPEAQQQLSRVINGCEASRSLDSFPGSPTPSGSARCTSRSPPGACLAPPASASCLSFPRWMCCRDPRAAAVCETGASCSVKPQPESLSGPRAHTRATHTHAQAHARTDRCTHTDARA